MNKIAAIMSGILFCLVVGLWLDRAQQYQKGYKDGYAYIKSIEEIQKQVGVKQDGLWGPVTNAAYGRAICNQYAKGWFEVKKNVIKRSLKNEQGNN